MKPLFVAFILFCGPAFAAGLAGSQIVISGEIHDNPAHQAGHAELALQIGARAIVFEMLTPAQAARITPALLNDAAALADALQWHESGWPDFQAYYPIFTAVAGARHYGAAVPRDAARAAFDTGIASAFGPKADAFGLTTPLPAPQQKAREAFQMAAHCDALPPELLPKMVAIQRLRDATLARVAIEAFAATGGPVLVVTGNGHARGDWGVPVYLAHVRPDITVFMRGQGETGSPPSGSFDEVRLVTPVDRQDPCAAFGKG